MSILASAKLGLDQNPEESPKCPSAPKIKYVLTHLDLFHPARPSTKKMIFSNIAISMNLKSDSLL